MSELHVVLGAGQIGTLVAERLLGAGHRVKMVRRGVGPAPLRGVELVRADLTDAAHAREIGRGATAVYQCTNPRYHRWNEELLPLNEGALQVAREGARLVVLDNVYALGRAALRGPKTPNAPVSRKGELRARMADRLREAHARGEARVVIARPSDFVGPNVERSFFGERFWSRAISGRAIEMYVDQDTPHAYSYAPDVAASLVALGATDAALGETLITPTLPARTTRAWIEALGLALGRPIHARRLPRWVLTAMGLVQPEAGEVVEMLYQWEAPFLVDHADFPERFGVQPTPFPTQIDATVAWARARFGTRAAA